MTQRALLWLVVVLLSMALLFRVSFAFQDHKGIDPAREQAIFRQVQDLIAERYVDPVDQQKLFYGALQGMAGALDPHTTFWTPQQYELEQSSTSGHFAGIGIEISFDEEKGLEVVTPLTGSPAFQAGLEPEDRIIKIDDKSTLRMDLEEASRLIRGQEGTPVRLTVQRKGAREPLEFVIVRGIIKIQSVQDAVLLNAPESLEARIPAGTPPIGYVRLGHFQEESLSDLGEALERLNRQGMRALILDLRQNPGGLLKSAQQICDLFIEEGTIVSTRARAPNGEALPEEIYRARKEGTQPNYPMAVLVDSHSASASEIVAGCLKDLKRAAIVGEKTFGKGSVQTIIPLNLGELGAAALKLTTAKYYTPSGVSIEKTGVLPDHPLALNLDQLRSLISGWRRRHLSENDPRPNGLPRPAKPGPPLPGAPESGPGSAPGSGAAGRPVPVPPEPFHDLQLEKAVEVLSEKLKKAAP